MSGRLTIRTAGLLVALVGVALVASCSGDNRTEEAIRVCNAYLEAWKAGDEELARSYLTPESRAVLQFAPTEKSDRSDYRFTIIKTETTPDYVEVQVLGETKGQQLAMFKYVVKQGDKYLLQFPFLIFARDWPVTVSQHFTVHCQTPFLGMPGDTAKDTITPDTTVLEEFYREISYVTGTEYPGRIDYYRCRDKDDASQLIGVRQRPWTTIGSCVIDTRRHSLELLTSLLTNMQKGPITALRVALAVYEDRRRQQWEEWTPDMIERRNEEIALSIERLADHPVRTAFADPNAGEDWEKGQFMAEAAGAFVAYLIDTYGLEKFRSLYRQSDTQQEFLKQVPAIYGVDLETLEKQLIAMYEPYWAKHKTSSKGST